MTLVICVGIICDERNKIPKMAQPTLLGFMLMLIQFSIAWNASNAMNPARDLGPRLMTFAVGYGWDVFRLVLDIVLYRICTIIGFDFWT